MNLDNVYVTRLCAWSPGMESYDDWNEWALGKKSILTGSKGPEILFTDSLFRRRLSQISKMTIQVIHDLLPFSEDTKIFFLSFRGELSRQYQINKMLIEEKELSPAVFSLSVFNAPAALAAMALKLKGGYTALYPAKNSFSAGLKSAASSLLCGSSNEICFVYADEEVKSEYGVFFNEVPPPIAFGILLSKTVSSEYVKLDDSYNEENSQSFLKKLLNHKGIYASS